MERRLSKLLYLLWNYCLELIEEEVNKLNIYIPFAQEKIPAPLPRFMNELEVRNI